MDINALYEEWKQNTSVIKPGILCDGEDMPLYNDLINIKEDSEEIYERFYRELDFGTAGLRGVIGAGTNRMNIFTVGKVTYGVAKYLNRVNTDRKSVVAIAYDSRHMSTEFAKASAAVLNAQGVITYVFDVLEPTPVLSYAVRYLKADAGIMITASHNPAKYNGYKLYGNDGAQIMPEPCKIISEEIAKVESFFGIASMSEDDARAAELYKNMPEDLLKTYYSLVESVIIDRNVIEENKEKIKIVYSPLFGCGNVPVCEMLTRLGFDFIPVKEQQMPNGAFPGLKNPNPEYKEAFVIAKEYGEKYGATLLVATDPDADRIGIMSKYNGEYYPLTGNQTGALLLDYILTKRKDNGTLEENAAFVKTIVTSVLADKIASSFGVETISVFTGFKFIADKIQLFEQQGRQFILGFEESYGYLSGSFVRDKDAVIAAVLICEMAAYYASKNITVYEALLALYEKYGYSIENVMSFEFEGAKGMILMAEIMEKFRNSGLKELAGKRVVEFKDYKAMTVTDLVSGAVTSTGLASSNVLEFVTDGDTKVIIRPSGTEPKIKFYFFSADKDKASADKNMQELKDDVVGILEKFKGE